MEVVAVVHALKVKRCFSTAAPSKSIHVLDNETDAGLKALWVLRGAVACCCQAGTGRVLDNEADSVLQALQLQTVRRLYGAPLLQGPCTSRRLGPNCSCCGLFFFFLVRGNLLVLRLGGEVWLTFATHGHRSLWSGCSLVRCDSDVTFGDEGPEAASSDELCSLCKSRVCEVVKVGSCLEQNPFRKYF